MSAEGLAAAVEKMRAGDVQPTAIEVFAHYYRQLEQGATGLIAESDIRPLDPPPTLSDLDIDDEAARAALDSTVVIKLNGGLGTSMGLAAAKSLLPVRDGLSFLDIIVRQVLARRRAVDARLPLVFMNSFRTREETLAALAAYPDLPVDPLPPDFLQNREPKLTADGLTPVQWPADPSLEWCPPGHGDLYTALYGSGTLTGLLEAGYRYAFVSNADNLGATPDPRVAGWFAASGAPFASEVCRRTAADRKGGQLAVRRRDGRLILRESAQTSPEDEAAFADVETHRFFNTNNLWMDLPALNAALAAGEGVLGLALIRNEKTVDPADQSSVRVMQIETAMGAAVEVFEGARALEVERSRFLPVKTTTDLLLLRSDVYALTDDFALELSPECDGVPVVDLDPDFYSLVGDFDERFAAGPPSLAAADRLEVRGDWTFGEGVVVRGEATVTADGSPGTIPAKTVIEGRYGGQRGDTAEA
jgi:UTP--glucose-1-phosphate uridylyltransferase